MVCAVFVLHCCSQRRAQYALHDSEATPPVWAARVRLTPELLNKLRQDPERVLLQLNVFTNDGSLKSRVSKKKTSLMTLDLAGTEERYELLSFSEDPGINHVCTFRRPADKELESGYNIYKTGEIYQKLLVQRLLDDTEKDRIKDKHAKSVQESKSRSSKMIDSKMQQNNVKRQRRRTLLSSVSVATTTTSAAGGLKRYGQLVQIHFMIYSIVPLPDSMLVQEVTATLCIINGRSQRRQGRN